MKKKLLALPFLLLMVAALVAVGGLAEAKKASKSSKKKDAGPTGPIAITQRSAAIEKIPNYTFPFPATYRFDVTRTYPNSKSWVITDSLFRKQLAVRETGKYPPLNLRFTEKILPATEEIPYRQEISTVRELLPGELAKKEFTFLVFNLEQPGELKVDLVGQDLEIAIHKEGYSGSMAKNPNASQVNKSLEFYGLTGMYSVKLKLNSTLPTRFSFKITWTPDEPPATPTPTPNPELMPDDDTTDESVTDGYETTEEAPTEEETPTDDSGEEGGTEGEEIPYEGEE